MAGSRREKIGSIFSRMTGLLRAGAVKEEDRPIWYDIVKALPPKPVPPPKSVQKILYPEDFVRVHFYHTFMDPGAVAVSDDKIKSVPQRFVDKYLELQAQKTVPSEQMFDEAVRLLKEEGVKLITHAERQASQRTRPDSSQSQQQQQSWSSTGDDYSTSKVTPVHDSNIIRSGQTHRKSVGPQVDLGDLFKENT